MKAAACVEPVVLALIMVAMSTTMVSCKAVRNLMTPAVKTSTAVGLTQAPLIPGAAPSGTAGSANPADDAIEQLDAIVHPGDTVSSDSAPADSITAATDDGHWRDRRRDEWQDPCWTGKGPFGVKPAPENDGRLHVDLCDVEMPFPASVGFDLKTAHRDIGYLKLENGGWECLEQDQPDGEAWGCGEIHVSDVAYVDFDRDGKMEAVVYFMSFFGGNCESNQIYAYKIQGNRPRFRAIVEDNDAYRCDERSLRGIEPYGKHCVKALTDCDKNCHGCEGTPCYDIFAWTGKTFEIAESWLDANSESGLPGSIETKPELLKLCGSD